MTPDEQAAERADGPTTWATPALGDEPHITLQGFQTGLTVDLIATEAWGRARPELVASSAEATGLRKRGQNVVGSVLWPIKLVFSSRSEGSGRIRTDRNNLVGTLRCLTERDPIRHQLAASFKEIGPQIDALDCSANLVRHRGLDNLRRAGGAFARPCLERAPEPVRHDRPSIGVTPLARQLLYDVP